MELEGEWWKGQLAADIYHALRYKVRSISGDFFRSSSSELKLPSYKGQSPQLSLRRYFADLIAIVSNRFRLCPAARHLAVYLLDLFMDRYDISVQQLHVVALSCLLLASKFEEREDHVPKLEQLNSLGCMTNMNLVLTKQSLMHMELMLLDTFQWNLYLPTAAHFIDYYLSIAVHETDLHDGWPMVCLEKTRIYMAKYADYFLEVSLQDHVFLNYAPSLVAAACVASSRIILRLSPTWPIRLHRLTAYSWDLLVSCVERLLIAHDNDVKEANKQKCQQPNPQTGHTVYPPQSQGNAAPPQIQQHLPQYLHRQQLQYPQQNCAQIISTGHMPSYAIQSHPTSLQASIQPHGHIQAVTGMTLPAPLDVKVNLPYNKCYQVNGHYTCTAPCFDR
nr:PREDICTED: cyclin-J isoform X1 [Lepisosteus oculatus]XP_015202062.1 PREDICTED: cyclin-J isoform X1 [Lepisosteus oculatus]